ncbi:MAG TPA: NAD-dependent epimerase/dehydratase family protein [Burkholderiales bacterium]|nr:NAD-dependent epimerase/dehydratase family protein [Burkholderiales bacterium]
MAGGLHVVFGAGPLGVALVRALEARNLRTRLVTRGRTRAIGSATPSEWVEADATNSQSAQRACAGASVVYHCAGAPYQHWAELLPRMMDGIAGAARVAEAKLIYADNAYLYGKVIGPMKEDLPSNPNTRKGRVRAQLADRLLEAHHRGGLRAAIGRGSDFFGPNVLFSYAGNRLFPQVLSGKTVDALGDPDKRHSFTFIDDFAAALVVLGEREEALGRAWHVPNSEPVTYRAFVERACRLAGTEPKLRVVPRWIVGLLSLVDPTLREVKEMLYQYEDDFVVDGSRFTRTFGLAATSLDDAITETLGWYRQAASTIAGNARPA